MVSNQWGGNINDFIEVASNLGYAITPNKIENKNDIQITQDEEQALSLWQKIKKMLGLSIWIF